MTAEVAVLNRSAVALAADSAVSVQHKVYDSANKLFTLSKYQPVGVMVFGRADFMGMPWEVWIKSYRAQLGETSFAAVRGYAEDFFQWLKTSESSIIGPVDEAQPRRSLFASAVMETIKSLEEEARDYLFSHLDGGVDSPKASDIVRQAITTYEQIIQNLEDIEIVGGGIIEEADVLNDLSDPLSTVDDYLAYYQDVEPISILASAVEKDPKIREKIGSLAAKLAAKGWIARSGIVFAGFGDDEYAPSLVQYDIEAIFNGKLKCVKRSVHGGGGNAILPFAQTEMTDRFVKGIDPDYKQEVIEYLNRIFELYPGEVIDQLEKEGALKENSDPTQITAALHSIGHQLIEDFRDMVDQYEQQSHIDPIIRNVGNLPKDELGVMAETFVNITSFKRKVSGNELETVGGPIDVAIISKGDGFIWVKRKHYFRPELNMSFFETYFRP